MTSYQTIILLVTVSFTSVLCSKMPPDALASAMKEILSTKNTEQLAQMIKDAANIKNDLPEMSNPTKRNAIIEAGRPRAVIRNEVIMPRNVATQRVPPTKVIVQKPNEIIMPMNVAIQKPNELAPKMLIKKPESAMQKKVLVQSPEVAVPNRRILVQKADEIPLLKNLMLQNANVRGNKGAFPKAVVVKANDVPLRVQPQVARPVSEGNVAQRVVVIQPSIGEYVAQDKFLSSKPVLPALSSVLSMSVPVSSTINMPQARGQFLRKIPIPPPTI